MSFDELKKKLENGIALQPFWNEEDILSWDEKTMVFAVMKPILLSPTTLKVAYEILCEEYRRRLCESWRFHFDDSWWMADRIGDGLFLGDVYNIPIDMPMLRLIVENGIGRETWTTWCDFVENEIHEGRNIPRINFYSWWKGMRPEMLTEEND